jgi:hypothetical protein
VGEQITATNQNKSHRLAFTASKSILSITGLHKTHLSEICLEISLPAIEVFEYRAEIFDRKGIVPRTSFSKPFVVG